MQDDTYGYQYGGCTYWEAEGDIMEITVFCQEGVAPEDLQRVLSGEHGVVFSGPPTAFGAMTGTVERGKRWSWDICKELNLVPGVESVTRNKKVTMYKPTVYLD